MPRLPFTGHGAPIPVPQPPCTSSGSSAPAALPRGGSSFCFQSPCPGHVNVEIVVIQPFISQEMHATSGRFRHGRIRQPPGAAFVHDKWGAARALLSIIWGNWQIGAPYGCRRPCLLRMCRAQKLYEKGKGEGAWGTDSPPLNTSMHAVSAVDAQMHRPRSESAVQKCSSQICMSSLGFKLG